MNPPHHSLQNPPYIDNVSVSSFDIFLDAMLFSTPPPHTHTELNPYISVAEALLIVMTSSSEKDQLPPLLIDGAQRSAQVF